MFSIVHEPEIKGLKMGWPPVAYYSYPVSHKPIPYCVDIQLGFGQMVALAPLIGIRSRSL
jgi:hypothetical protein